MRHHWYGFVTSYLLYSRAINMPSPLAPHPIRVQPCVWYQFWTNRNGKSDKWKYFQFHFVLLNSSTGVIIRFNVQFTSAWTILICVISISQQPNVRFLPKSNFNIFSERDQRAMQNVLVFLLRSTEPSFKSLKCNSSVLNPL